MNNKSEAYTNKFLDDIMIKTSDAFKIWSKTPVDTRAMYLRRLRIVISLNQDKISSAISKDTLKPITENICQEITSALEMLRYLEKNYPKWLRDNKSSYIMNYLLRKTNIIRFEPKGVIAIIGPSNFPFSLIIMQAAVSIICGNCAVLKPSEKCPNVNMIIKEIIRETGLPDSVIELIEGGKQTAGELISKKQIVKVIFTGSYQSGKEVAELCGKYFKQCILELGGGGIAVLCKDANIVKAAKCIVWSSSYCNGQSCIGTRVVLAVEDIFKEFSTLLKKEINLINARHNYNSDTIFGFKMKIKFIEQKGEVEYLINDRSVLVIKNVKSIDQAISYTNDSEYGLSVSVWSKNIKSALEISKLINAGIVWINDSSIALPDFPWGGIKNSGWGRLYSRETINELTDMKIISIDKSRSEKGKKWWSPYNQNKLRAFKAVNGMLGGKITFGSIKEFVKNYLF